jgi:hypothetical protein
MVGKGSTQEQQEVNGVSEYSSGEPSWLIVRWVRHHHIFPSASPAPAIPFLIANSRFIS